MKKIMNIILVYLLFFILSFEAVKATELDDHEIQDVTTTLMNQSTLNIDQVLEKLYSKYTPANPMKVFEEIAKTGRAIENNVTYTGDQKKIYDNLPSALRTGVKPVVLKKSYRSIKNGVLSITYFYEGAGIYRTQRYMLTLSATITEAENAQINPLHAAIRKKNNDAAAAAIRPDNN